VREGRGKVKGPGGNQREKEGGGGDDGGKGWKEEVWRKGKEWWGG